MMFLPLITLLLISFALNVSGYVKPPITSTTTTTTTTMKSPKCHSPNQTEANSCGCWQTCEGIQLCQTCYPGQLPKCKCSKGYVTYGYDLDHCVLPKDCPCKRPNEEYTLCSTCEGTCTDPNPICIQKQSCGSPMCQCKVGYVRGPDGVCIPPYSCPSKILECTAPTPAPTTPPTTKKSGIRCYNGTGFFPYCSVDKNMTECLEKQKAKADSNFAVIQCESQDDECYSVRHSCQTTDGEYLVKGCGSSNYSCQNLRYRFCRFGDSNIDCLACKGDECNKDLLDYYAIASTTKPTTKSYS